MLGTGNDIKKHQRRCNFRSIHRGRRLTKVDTLNQPCCHTPLETQGRLGSEGPKNVHKQENAKTATISLLYGPDKVTRSLLNLCTPRLDRVLVLFRVRLGSRLGVRRVLSTYSHKTIINQVCRYSTLLWTKIFQ